MKLDKKQEKIIILAAIAIVMIIIIYAIVVLLTRNINESSNLDDITRVGSATFDNVRNTAENITGTNIFGNEGTNSNSNATGESTVDYNQLTPEEKNKSNYTKAKDMLEFPSEGVNESVRTTVNNTMIQSINTIASIGHLNNIIPENTPGMANTNGPMLNTFAMVLLVNKYSYNPNLLEVTPTSNAGIVQVLIPLTKENVENCYFIANYNMQTGQMELVRYVGGQIGATFG